MVGLDGGLGVELKLDLLSVLLPLYAITDIVRRRVHLLAKRSSQT